MQLPNSRIFRGPCVGSPRKIPWTSPPLGHENDPTGGGGSKRARGEGSGSQFGRPQRQSLAAAKPRSPNLPSLRRPPHALRKRRPGRHNGVRVPQPGANHRSAPPTLKILSPLGFTKPPVPQNAVAYRVFREPVPNSRFLRCPPARDLPPRSIPTPPEIILAHPRPLPDPLRPLRTRKTRNSIIPTPKCHFGSQPTAEFPPTKVLNPPACNCHFGATPHVNSLPC